MPECAARSIQSWARRRTDREPFYFESAGAVPGRRGDVRLCGAVVKIDETTGRAVRIVRVDEPAPHASVASEPEPKTNIENSSSSEQT